MRPGETPEQARERRLRESARVEERVVDVSGADELQEQLDAAGSDLVVVEVGVISVHYLLPPGVAFIQIDCINFCVYVDSV